MTNGFENGRLSRRAFLVGGSAALFASGCRTGGWFGAPKLRFGVVSDIHATTPESVALFEKSMRYFRGRGVDAVMVTGDLSDWGLRSSLGYVRAAWQRVFAGTDVVPLFCTGNHDYDGWHYGDMSVEMRANGYSEEDRLNRDAAAMAAGWEEIFGEKFAPIRMRTVKGYDFVSAEYYGYKGLGPWMAAHRDRFAGDRPFFFFQHLPIRGTTGDSFGSWTDKGVVKPVLDQFPNVISFTGHTHRPFADERQIWQGTFTAIATPSLSYLHMKGEYENCAGDRAGQAWQTMPPVPMRRDLRGGEGFVVSVYEDEMVVERVDLEEDGAEGGAAWVVPLRTAARPFETERRTAASVAPAFPAGATLETCTRNTENRRGFWAIVMNCEFPAAAMPDGSRVHHYEIRAVPKDGSEPLVKRFFSPAFGKLPKYEPKRMRFWFDVKELPKGEYVLEARAYNSFGKCSAALRSKPWNGK